MAERVASALWWITPELVVALDAHLGLPVDSYVNGSQTWLVDDGDLTLEWRLHPVGGFTQPDGLSHYDLWEQVVAQLSAGDVTRRARARRRDPRARGRSGTASSASSRSATTSNRRTSRCGRPARSGIAPDLCGLVDHQAVGDRWEQAKGEVSIVQLLADQLAEG